MAKSDVRAGGWWGLAAFVAAGLIAMLVVLLFS